MRYIRSHLQRNLLFRDEKVDDDQYKPEWKPELFDLSKMRLVTNNHVYEYLDKDIDVILESSNYFTVVNKNKKDISCIRFEDVTHMDFELTNPEVIK